MGHDLAKLASQGRAFSGARLWTNEENEAVALLVSERNLSRPHAADHVRNGILTLEVFDKATKKEFVPKTLEEAQADAEAALKERGEEFSEGAYEELKGSELKKELKKRGLPTSGKVDELRERLRETDKE